MSRIGIIGGTGLYHIEGIKILEKKRISTPFGEPSDVFLFGELDGRQIVFLPRHGKNHHLLPSEVNNRANIWAMKSQDVNWIISVSAVGSLKSEYKPMDMVVVDQFFDRTKQWENQTFFGKGIIAHISFAQPLCIFLRQVIFNAGESIGATIHWGGTYLNMEGPAFSTLAESQTYRSWGMDVIGMTQLREAKLAREAEICYATLAMVTDYDCWYEAETGETVSVDMIIENMNKNVNMARELIKTAILHIPIEEDCACRHSLETAILTDKKKWPVETVEILAPILKKYL